MELTEEIADYYNIDSPQLLDGLSGPITLINYFALREHATYHDPTITPCSGLDAMLRYSSVSGDRLSAAGGTFLMQGFHLGSLWGPDEPWDLVVVASYPEPSALHQLLTDPEYRSAFVHRRAAIERERVTLCATIQ